MVLFVVPFQNNVQQHHTQFKMAAVAKNKNVFNCSLLLYTKWWQKLTWPLAS
jgi:hypothetical protein